MNTAEVAWVWEGDDGEKTKFKKFSVKPIQYHLNGDSRTEDTALNAKKY